MDISVTTSYGKDSEVVQYVNASIQEVVNLNIVFDSVFDVKAMLAFERRVVEIAHVTGKKIRLITDTKDLRTEKSVVRLFADREDVFVSVDWR